MFGLVQKFRVAALAFAIGVGVAAGGAPTAAFTSITDNVGDTAGGVPVTIVGTGLTGATGVTIGGVALTSFLVVDATHITGVTGAHAKGTVDVVILHPNGNVTSVGAYEYWNPSSVSSCILWYRPDLGLAANGTPEVTNWNDQSGVGDTARNLVPAGTDKPAFNATDATYNNKPTVGTFNKAGVANDCRLKTGTTWSATYGFPLTICAYGHTAGASNRYFSEEQGTDRVAINTQTTAVHLLSGSAGGGDDLATGAGQPVTSPTLFIGEMNGASSAIYVNATVTPTTSGSLATAPSLGNAAFNVGSFIGAATSFGVERIAEFFIFNAILSGADKVKLRKYVNGRYNRSLST